MLRKLFLCVAVVVGCAFGSFTAAAGEAGEYSGILIDFGDFNPQKIITGGKHGQLPEIMSAAIAPAFQQMGLDKYVSDIAMVEQAMCLDKSKMKSFLKKCNKAIKKAKLPQIYASEQEGFVQKIYAKDGRIVILNQCDDDFANIAAIAGPKSTISGAPNKGK